MNTSGASRGNRDALSLKSVPMIGTLAAGECWALAGGILVPTAIPAAANIQTLLNSIGSTRGMTLRRGAALWEALTLGASGQVLSSNGTDAVWATPSSYTADAPVAYPAAQILAGDQVVVAATPTAVGALVSLVNASTTKNMLCIGSFAVSADAAAPSNASTWAAYTNDGSGVILPPMVVCDILATRGCYTIPWNVVIPPSTSGLAWLYLTPGATNVTVRQVESTVTWSRLYF